MPNLNRGVLDGFPGQRMVVVPRPIVRRALADQLPIPLVPTDIGYFPQAADHYCERMQGCPQLILILCVSGRGWVNLRMVQQEVSPGQLVVILPGEPHRYGATPGQPWTIYWCHADGKAAGRLGSLIRPEAASAVMDVGDQPRLVALFEEITEELGRGYGADHLIPASMTLAHAIGLAMAVRRRSRALSDATLRVQDAIRYLSERPQGQVSVPELASMSNLSVSHFCAVFKTVTGFPPLDYFIRLKLRRACELLDATKFAVKEIAEELGFDDAHYFSRLFKKIYSLPPSEYRKRVKG